MMHWRKVKSISNRARKRYGVVVCDVRALINRDAIEFDVRHSVVTVQLTSLDIMENKKQMWAWILSRKAMEQLNAGKPFAHVQWDRIGDWS